MPMCENKKVVSSENDKFSFKDAGINLGKGLISPITVMIQHPLKTLGVLAATGAATLVMPAIVPIMLVGFGGYSLYELGKGIAVAGKEYKNGNYKASENAFQSIGSGIVGSVMTAFGVRPTAQVAIQSKRAAQLGGPITKAHKYIINQKVKQMSYFEALKENISMFTTKEGLKAAVDSLNPRSIIDRIICLREPKRYTEEFAKYYARTAEGKLRRNMSHQEMCAWVKKISDSVFTELGVPVSQRPKIIVRDHISCFSPDEINKVLCDTISKHSKGQRISNVTIFRQNEKIKEIPFAQLAARIKAAFKDVQLKDGVSLDSIVDGIINFSSVLKGGSYHSKIHAIEVNATAFRAGFYYSLEEIVAHEALHAKMAILRNSLPQERVSEIIKMGLLRRIRTGEIGVIPSVSGERPVMVPPKFSPSMRKELLNFARKYLYKSTQDSDILSYVKQRNAYLKDVEQAFKASEYSTVPDFLEELMILDSENSEIYNAIVKIVKRNSDFIMQNGGLEEKAVQTLLDYIGAHEARYIGFSKQKLPRVEELPLSGDKIAEAEKSVYGRISTYEGNFANQTMRRRGEKSAEAFAQYKNSYEEVLARNTAHEYKINLLNRELSSGSLTDEQRALNVLKKEVLERDITANSLCRQYYKLKQYVANNPTDEMAKLKYETAKKAYEEIVAEGHAKAAPILNQKKILTPDFAKQTAPLALNINNTTQAV